MYLNELGNGLNGGSTLKIPVQVTNSITSPLTSALSQNILINCGYYASVNSISYVHKETPLANSEKKRLVLGI